MERESSVQRVLISVKLPKKLLASLNAASIKSDDWDAPTRTQIIERGIHLALKELRENK